MKQIKRLTTLALAVMLLLSLAIPAFAVNITIDDKNVTGAEYSAYKLLNATNSAGDDGENTRYAYTLNTKYTAVLQEVTGKTTEADIIEYISKLNDAGIRDFADAVYAKVKNMGADATATENVFTGVDQGYYLIVETKVGTAPGYDKDTYSLVMLDTAGLDDITVETKEELPTSQKKVKDKNDTAGSTTNWQDSADHDIGDAVPFQIIFTLPSDFANYENYFVGIHDVQAEGLTFIENSLTVTVGSKDITEWFTYSTPDNCSKGCTFHIQCADIIAKANAEGVTLAAGANIVFEYTSTLNENAVLGSTGNPNEMTIEFSNNPYGDGTSETPKDRVIVFTYKVNVDKYSETVAEGNELKGAGFTLYKEVPAGTTNAQTGAAIKAAFADNIKATALADDKHYVVAAEVETDKDGDTFGFKGVDDGNYVLVETTVPAGYNAWDAVAFTITAEHDAESDDPKLTSLTGGDLFSGDLGSINKDTGILDTNIVNKSGVELPSTGGMGTTIFYALGGMMVLVAVVLLVTKKRMASAE